MRIGIGGIAHETNSFSNVATSEALFRRLTYNEGEALFTPGVRTFIGGFTDEGIAQGVDMAPVLYANANPSGRIPDETLETLRDRLVEGLWQQHLKAPLDGIVFAPHGAGAADSYPDIEGEILLRLRERFGWEIPIGVSLDLHANVTEEMMRCADVLIGVKCYPHVDTYETSRKVLSQVLDIIRNGGRKPCKRFVHLPWLLAPAYGVTLQGPAHDVQQLTIRLEENPELHSVTFFHGFPYADIPQAGVTVTAFADTQEAADKAAMEVATYAWNRRNDFPVAAISPAQALDMAQETDGIVVINESSDNPGGGAPGDGTHLLRELLKRNIPGSAFGHICDPEVAQLASNAGVGAKISCLLGAKTDKLHGEPIEIQDAYVKAICDGHYINQSPMGKGSQGRLGLTVRLRVGNVDIVVSSRARQTMDKGPFEIVGINYSEYKILCLKSSQHFRGWWQERAAKIIPCDPPGIHCADLSVFDFKMANTNYFPLGDAEWNG